MEIFEDIEQGGEEWLRIRMGMPTASIFKVLMAKTEEKKGRTTLLHKLAGERLCGEPAENYTNQFMDRGKSMEDEARQHYAFVRDCEPRRVGFIKNGKTGCSPDALLGDDGMLEIKTATPHVLIPMLLKAQADPKYFPSDHLAQCQGNLMVAERKWIDLIVYWPKMKPLIVRTERDENYIAQLRDAVDLFDLDLRRLVDKLK